MDVKNLSPLALNIFRIFELSKFSVDFDSHPEIAPSFHDPDEGREPGISPCNGVKLYRRDALDSDLTRSILACKLESNVDVYTLIEQCTLACAESCFPSWAEDELGGFGELTVSADGSATLNFTQRSQDAEEDAEYRYHYYKSVTFQI
jgi:hypothetical protein